MMVNHDEEILKEFFEQIVKGNLKDFQDEPHSRRKGYNACLTAHHFYEQVKDNIRQIHPLSQRVDKNRYKDFPHFWLCKIAADSCKHGKLTIHSQDRGRPKSKSGRPTEFALRSFSNTTVQLYPTLLAKGAGGEIDPYTEYLATERTKVWINFDGRHYCALQACADLIEFWKSEFPFLGDE